MRCRYALLCLAIGFLYFRMNKEWKNVYSRAALLFFACAFLSFMSISGFPAFVEEMKVFTRERLHGYYGVGSFVIANTAAALPFLALIAITSACAVYFIAGLNLHGFERFVYFCLDLFLSLVVAESLMMAIAPLVSHFLMGIAAGAGILGFVMLVCGFFQPRRQLPKPVFLYPFHYLSFETYSFFGFMNNEFAGTTGWGCPCSAQPGGCPPQLGGDACTLDGDAVLQYWCVGAAGPWRVARASRSSRGAQRMRSARCSGADLRAPCPAGTSLIGIGGTCRSWRWVDGPCASACFFSSPASSRSGAPPCAADAPRLQQARRVKSSLRVHTAMQMSVRYALLSQRQRRRARRRTACLRACACVLAAPGGWGARVRHHERSIVLTRGAQLRGAPSRAPPCRR